MTPAALVDEPMEEDGASVGSSGRNDDDDDNNNNNVTPTSSDFSHVDVDMDVEPSSGGPTSGQGETGEEGRAPPIKNKELEELFDDLDDDIASMSSAAIHTPGSSFPVQEPQPTVDITTMKASEPEIMRSFYQRLFPWRQLFHWLNHSPTPTNDFKNREFAFELANGLYMRYQSYTTGEDLRKDVLRLNPTRFEIGPTYNTNPRDRKTLRNSSAFKPLEKELCFDIDLTDYDEIRTCCDKANICQKCWQFVVMAIKVVDEALREDFGFKHIMWVYSGRRGAHAWVCDKKARSLEDQKRKAIVGYLELIKGGAQSAKKVNVRRPLHPHLTRSLDILKPYFQEDVLSTQNPWESGTQAEKLLQLLPDRTLNHSLRRKWEAAPGRSSTSKWADIDAVAKSGASKNLDAKALLEAKQDIVLEYTYPRLDVEVSKRLNHLLKSPFVVHPKTGRVCVPIDMRTVDEFDLLGVPTVQGLLAEIDAWTAKREDQGDHEDDGGDDKARTPIADWEKTSLKPFVEYFRSFVNGIMKEEGASRVKREREEEGSMEF